MFSQNDTIPEFKEDKYVHTTFFKSHDQTICFNLLNNLIVRKIFQKKNHKKVHTFLLCIEVTREVVVMDRILQVTRSITNVVQLHMQMSNNRSKGNKIGNHATFKIYCSFIISLYKTTLQKEQVYCFRNVPAKYYF